MSLVLLAITRGMSEAALLSRESQAAVRYHALHADVPPSVVALLRQAWSAERAGQPEESISLYRRALLQAPLPAWVSYRLAACYLASGSPVEAQQAEQTACGGLSGELCGEPFAGFGAGPVDGLISAALREQAGQRAAAARDYRDAITRLFGFDEPEAGAIERSVERGNEWLQQGRYQLAQHEFSRALKLVDILLRAHAAWMLLEPRTRRGGLSEELTGSLVSLGQLADTLLRCQARVKLAGNVASALRARQLRSELAGWATSAEDVRRLLSMELARLNSLARARVNHAEIHYRRALLARALDQPAAAEEALRNVLDIVPEHAGAAARLAVTLLETGRGLAAQAVLEQVRRAQTPMLRKYYLLAVGAEDDAEFERRLLELEQNPRLTTGEVRANLAFALEMLGREDAQRAEWKNPVAV